MGHAILATLISLFITFAFAEHTTTTEIYETTIPTFAEDDIHYHNSSSNSTAPGKPYNLSVLDVHPTSLLVRFLPPVRPNGFITGYRIYYIHDNYTEVQSLTTKGLQPPAVVHNLTHLIPNTEYKLWVKAFSAKNEGDPSDAIFNRTDIGGPAAPHIVNLTCEKQNTIYVQWQRPAKFYNTITYYYIYVTGEYYEDNNMIQLAARSEYLDASYSIPNITTNAIYEVRLGASSYSKYTKRIIHGNLSHPVQVHMRTDCDKIRLYMMHTTGEFSAGMIAGIVCAITALILAVTAFIVWRKYFHAPCYYLDDPRSGHPSPLDWNLTPTPPSEHRGAIPVNLFSQHVSQLHVDGDIGFSKEYEMIQINQKTQHCEHSQHLDNRIKNRYLNIIAYDHTRVQLLHMPGMKKKTLDYINANYIDGFGTTRAYIGTQGPLPSTFDAFWRMIWEQRVTIIVMITNLVERGRRKCDMYWPKEGSEIYGVMQVKLVKEDIMATYTVRTLLVRHLKVDVKKKKSHRAEKVVYQYHYTNWPDHGTPDHPLPVLHFIKKSATANPQNAGPIVVHCSAGVGRTGTYIVIDAMMRQIRKRGEVNICGFLTYIRTQRNFLVQTEEQYIFIHDAVLETIQSGETNISREEFPKYLEAIQDDSEEKLSQWKSIQTQFGLVTSYRSRDYNLVAATKPVNLSKNRLQNVVATDTTRVHLTPKPGEDGSDYINATWMQGFHSLREFIITQHPTRKTICDFWQLVWDHNTQTIVMLSTIDNQDFEVFWPCECETVETEHFRVRLSLETVISNYVLRNFVLQSLQDDYEFHVRMVHCTNWPHHCASIADMYHLPNTVQETQMGFHNGPMLVVDRYGASEAATFCNLISLKKHMQYDNHVDVYMYSKLYHNRRPGVWSSIDDYLRLHYAVQTLCHGVLEPLEVISSANGSQKPMPSTSGASSSGSTGGNGSGSAHGSTSTSGSTSRPKKERVTAEGMEAVEPQPTVA